MDRKDFLKYLGLTPFMLESIIKTLQGNRMLERKILSSGELLPCIGLGTWQQFDIDLNSSEKENLIEVLNLLFQKGGKLIDSSPMYQRSENVVGELLKNSVYKNDLFYATKVWTTGRQSGIDQMNQSFKFIKKDQIDLMQIHNLLDWKSHLKILREWKEKGKIRYIGITHYTISAHDEIERIIKNEADIDFIQINYNIIDRNVENSLLETAQKQNVSVIVNRPFEGGQLFKLVRNKQLPHFAKDYGIQSWGQYFLKYVISHPAIHCVIPGTSNPKHMLDNLSAGFGEMPNSALREKMLDYI